MNILIISDNAKFIGCVKFHIVSVLAGGGRVSECSCVCAVTRTVSVKPSLIVLDIDSASIPDPAEYLSRLRPRHLVPIIVCTERQNMKYAMVNAGAIDVITKTDFADQNGYFAKRFCDSLRLVQRSVDFYKANSIHNCSKIIAIGGSTGSTQALPVILKGLTHDTPPVICVLHMPGGYTKLYAEGLNNEFDLEITEAKQGMYLHSGQVVIAQGSKHLRLFKDKKGYFINSEPGVKVSGHCPSVDVLFDSVAYAAKSDAVGVILTGMGSDGAKGMLNMRKMGAYNIGQDESTSAVYGMPRSAFENGSVNKQAPLESIADEINKYLSRS